MLRLTRSTPAFVVPVEDGPPPNGPTGWLAQADSKNVVISHLEFLEQTGSDRGWGLGFPSARNKRACDAMHDCDSSATHPGRGRSTFREIQSST